MILSDKSLRERLASGSIGIDPLDESAVQPASVDLRLSRSFRVFTRHRHTHIDPVREQDDLTAGRVRDLSTGGDVSFVPLPEVMVTILRDGGLVEHLKKHGGFALPRD